MPFFMNVFQPGEAPIMPQHAFDGIDGASPPACAARRSCRSRSAPGRSAQGMAKGSHIILERNPDYWDKGRPVPRPGRAARAARRRRARDRGRERRGRSRADERPAARPRSSALASCRTLVASQRGHRGARAEHVAGGQHAREAARRPEGAPGDQHGARPQEDRRRDLVRAGNAGDRPDRQRQPDLLQQGAEALRIQLAQGQRAARRSRLQARRRTACASS